MRLFRRRNRDLINDKVYMLGTTIDPSWIPPSASMNPNAVAAPPPIQVTCGCGVVSYHPQSCEAVKLKLSRGGPLPTAGVEMTLSAGEQVAPLESPADCYCCSGESRGVHCRHCHTKGYCG